MIKLLSGALARLRAQRWWRLWSNQFAVLAGALAAWIADNPQAVLGWIAHIESPWRQILTFFVTAGLPILLRMMRQPKLETRNGKQAIANGQ